MDSCLNYVFSILYLLVTLDRINIGIGNIGSFPLNKYEEGMHCIAIVPLPFSLSLPHPFSDQSNIHCLSYDHFVSSNEEFVSLIHLTQYCVMPTG